MLSHLLFALLSLILVSSSAQNTLYEWFSGSVNSYGPNNGNYTGGACGYRYAKSFNLGVMRGAASSSLWKLGKGCGSCYEVKCDASKSKKGSCNGGSATVTVTVTVTDLCYNGGSGYCNPPKKHLSLSVPAFLRIASSGSPYVNALIRKVPCKRQGNIKFKIAGKPWFFILQVFNVAGYAEIQDIYIQVNKEGSNWNKLNYNWGVVYSASTSAFYQQPLNVKLVLLNGQSLIIRKAIPSGWKIGNTYSAGQFSSS